MDGIAPKRYRSDFHRQLAQDIAALWLVDAHEHLIEERDRTALALDCFYLTAHYCPQDLVSAGMPKAHVDGLLDRSVPLATRWEWIAPYWPFVRTTGYGQAVEIAARDIFGVEGLSASTYGPLSDAVAASAGRPGWYDYVLKERARILTCILDGWRLEVDRRYFLPVIRFDDMIMARTAEQIRQRGECRDREIGSLSDYLAAMDATFTRYVEQGVVAIKCGLAYRRSLAFDLVPRGMAERLFARALRDELPEREAKLLQDFLFHEVCARAGAHGLPYQVHTGLQSANATAHIEYTNPVLLTTALRAHPETLFDLFHGGYPYGGELATIGKNFPNAYVNACWLAIIAPTVLRRQLHEWLDTVPHNKIQAFGGDYRFVELSYAHALMARSAVADVLAERVELGLLAEHEALPLARRLLAENGVALFKIDATLARPAAPSSTPAAVSG